MNFLKLASDRNCPIIRLYALHGLIDDSLRFAQKTDDGTVWCDAKVLSDNAAGADAFTDIINRRFSRVRNIHVKLKKLQEAIDFSQTGTAVCFGLDSDNNKYAFVIKRGLVDVIYDLRDTDHELIPVGKIVKSKKQRQKIKLC